MGVLAVIDRVDDLSMKEKNGIITQLKRVATVSGITAPDYSSLLEALVAAGVPLAGTPLVPPLLRRNNIFGMLVLVNRDVKIWNQDSGTAQIELDYQHFMESDNQDMSQLSLNLPSWDPQLPLGAAQGPPGAYIGWFSVFGKSKTSVQQTKTNFGYRPLPFDPIPMWKVKVNSNVTPWSTDIGWNDGDLVSNNGVVFRALVEIPPVNPPPVPGPSWRIAQLGVDYFIDPYAAGDVVEWKGFYWVAKRMVNTATPPFPGDDWKIAVAGVDYQIFPDARQKYQIVVGHKYPPEDKELGNQTVYQTGEITVMEPHRNYKVSGEVFTAFPWNLANNIIGRVNKFPWMNGQVEEWMCTEACWEAVFVRRKYRMSFEFQHNPDTWQPTAVFVDRRTGKPPAELVPGFGYVQVPYHEKLDFNAYFQSNFEI